MVILRPLAKTEHNYSRDESKLPLHIEYADDVDFICQNDENIQTLIKTVEEVFSKYQLELNKDKTETMELDPKEPRIEKIKKLGSYMEDGEDINNRKRLSWMAMAKYNDIWKNPYNKIPQK